MWCWKGIGIQIEEMTNEDVLRRADEKRSILSTIPLRTANWIRHVLGRNRRTARRHRRKLDGTPGVGGRRRRMR